MKSLIDRMKQDAEGKGGSYLKLKDGQQVRLRFLQELDPKASGYNEELGLAFYTMVHSAPGNFKKSAECTKDSEGACWACEQVDTSGVWKDDKGKDASWKWKPKGRLYVNVLVTDSDGQSVKVLQQGLSDKHIANNLIENAEEYGSITDRDYKLKRKGDGMNNTSYTLTSLDKSPLEVEGLTLHDLSKLVRAVAYANQETFYTSDEDDAEGTESGGGSNGWAE